VVTTGGNINLSHKQLFPSSSEEKAGGWLEYASGEIWLASHQLDCAGLEHPEGYSKPHSQKARFSHVLFRANSHQHCRTKIPNPHHFGVIRLQSRPSS